MRIKFWQGRNSFLIVLHFIFYLQRKERKMFKSVVSKTTFYVGLLTCFGFATLAGISYFEAKESISEIQY